MANNYPNFNPYNQYQQNWIDTYKAYQARITSIRGELSSVVITQEHRQNLQVGADSTAKCDSFEIKEHGKWGQTELTHI